MAKVRLETVLPVSIVDAPVIGNKYGDLCFAFAYEGPELFSCSKEKLLEVNTAFESGINFLDDSYVIHKQDIFLESVYKSGRSISSSFITNAYYEHFKNKRYYAQFSYLFVIKINGIGINRKYDLARRFGQEKRKVVSASRNIDLIRENVFAYASHLRACGIRLKAIKSDDDIYKLMDGYLAAYEEGALADLSFSREGIYIGNNKRVGIMAINSDENLPGVLQPCAENPDFSRKGNDNVLYSDLLYSLGYGFKANHIVNTMLFLDGQRFWRQELEKKSKTLKSLAAFGKANARMSDDNDAFLEATYAEEGRVVRSHVNVVFWANDHATFQGLEAEIKSKFISMGMVPHIANYLDQKAIFLSSFPGNAGAMPFEETFVTHSTVASSFFLKESVIDRSKGSPETHGLLYTDRAMNIPAFRDSFRTPYETKAINSRNVLVVGESGGGKSSTIIELLRQYLELGFDITAIDIGRSFEIFAKTYDGNYIVYEDGMSLGINPFSIEDGVLTVSRLEYLSSFIPMLWDPQSEFSNDRISAIEKLIVAFYQAEKQDGSTYRIGIDGSKLEISDFYQFIENNRSLVDEVTKGKETFFDTDSFLLSMEKYVSGKFDNLFKDTGVGMVDPSKRLTCFELDNIKDHPILFPIFSMLITHMSTEVLWQKRNSEKIFWFDEAWKVLEKPGMASLLKYLYKTVRKFDGAVGINIQTIGDLNVDHGNIEETILGNSPVKLIMKHKEELVSPIIRKLFGEDSTGQHARALLRSINSDLSGQYPYTEHLNIIGDDMKIMRMMVSPYQRVNFMSEFKDKEVLFRYLEESEGDMELAFAKFVQHKRW